MAQSPGAMRARSCIVRPRRITNCRIDPHIRRSAARTVADEIISHISASCGAANSTAPKTVGPGDMIRLLSYGVTIGSLAA